MRAVAKKWKSSAGFTLAEALVVLLIVLMVTMVVAAGLPAAQRAYQKVVDGANAQILLSTTATRLREELGTATDVVTNGADELLSYTGGRYGWKSSLINPDDESESPEDKIGIQVVWEREDGEDEKELLVTKSASAGLTTSFEKIIYDDKDGVFTVKNLEVKKDGTTLASLDELVIRSVYAP